MSQPAICPGRPKIAHLALLEFLLDLDEMADRMMRGRFERGRRRRRGLQTHEAGDEVVPDRGQPFGRADIALCAAIHRPSPFIEQAPRHDGELVGEAARLPARHRPEAHPKRRDVSASDKTFRDSDLENRMNIGDN